MQIFVMWLDAVTYLHHHGYEEKLPWYRGKVWDWIYKFFLLTSHQPSSCLVGWEFIIDPKILFLYVNQTGMELSKRRTYNSRSGLWNNQQHPPWYWDPCHTSPISSNPTLPFDRSCEYCSQTELVLWGI